MKITIVQGAFLPVPPLMGGAVEKIWFGLGKEFAERGHRVTHVSRSHSDLPEEETIDGVHHVRVPGFDTPSNGLILKLYDLIYSARVRRHLPAADVLVTNTFWLPILTPPERAGKVYVHVARYPKGQMILYRSAARIQGVSGPVAEAIRNQLPARYGSKVTAIPNPIPEGVPIRDQAPDYADRAPEILYVGRLHPEKGLEMLIRGFAVFRSMVDEDWVLNLVGPWERELGGGGSAYVGRLKTLAARTAGQVRFTGPVFDDERLYEHHRRARAFVYPSLAERGESFGLAPLEAMACGCPSVVSDLACFRDFVADGENGRFFDHRSADPEEELGQALRWLVGSESRWQALSARARSTAREFELSTVASEYLSDFREIVGPEVASEVRV